MPLKRKACLSGRWQRFGSVNDANIIAIFLAMRQCRCFASVTAANVIMRRLCYFPVHIHVKCEKKKIKMKNNKDKYFVCGWSFLNSLKMKYRMPFAYMLRKNESIDYETMHVLVFWFAAVKHPHEILHIVIPVPAAAPVLAPVQTLATFNIDLFYFVIQNNCIFSRWDCLGGEFRLFYYYNINHWLPLHPLLCVVSFWFLKK